MFSKGRKLLNGMKSESLTKEANFVCLQALFMQASHILSVVCVKFLFDMCKLLILINLCSISLKLA